MTNVDRANFRIRAININAMTEKRVTIGDVGDHALRALYQTAFPVEEQIPWEDLLRLVDEVPLDFTAYYEDVSNELVGFTIVFPHEPVAWLWYFAVSAEQRGQGKGQQILSSLIRRYADKTLVLDMESPLQVCDNVEQRKRRQLFYQRNGFHDTDAYRTFDGVEYTMMILGEGTFTQEDYDALIKDLRRFWWKKEDKR